MTAKFHVSNVCGLGKKLPQICSLPPPSHVKWSGKFPCKIGLNYFINYEKLPAPIRANVLGCILGI